MKCNILKEYVGNANIAYLPDSPRIFVGKKDRNQVMAELSRSDYLSDQYGQTIVTLSSTNTYSHGRVEMALSEYINHTIDHKNVKANETLYFFGNNYGGVWDTLASSYIIPPCRYCDEAGARTIGIAGAQSGVSFHFHGPGFSEVIIGRKRWFIFPPDALSLSHIDPNMTVARWVEEVYPKLPDTSLLQECVIEPGDMLYFPANWMHATLNLDTYNVFMSLFLDTQLMNQL
jgi:hypothetical protein